MSPWNLFGKEKEKPEGESEETSEEPKKGLFGKLKAGLKKTRNKVAGGLKSVLTMGRKLDEDTIEQIEEQLYVADVGPRTVVRVCDHLRDAYKAGDISTTEEVLDYLKKEFKENLHEWDTELHLPDEGVAVILVAGVNGSGKTTSIGKLAHRFVSQGNDVLLAASDTFRAAAGEQLQIWASRTGAEIVRNESADPAAVAYDAAEKAVANDFDVLMIDTAGRLHTRRNLMKELQKICRVLQKKVPDAPHEVLMTLDAGTGQNAISQAIRFNQAIDLTGIVLAKLDGTAKGGIIFGMRDQIDIPVKFVGVGEQKEDLAPFDPDSFVDALFE